MIDNLLLAVDEGYFLLVIYTLPSPTLTIPLIVHCDLCLVN